MYMLFAKNEKELETQIQTIKINIRTGYRNGIWHRKICHVYKGQKNNGRNRTTESEEYWDTQRSRNLQELGNIGSGHHQSSGDERKNLKSITEERENYSKSSYKAEIPSKG